MKLSYNSQMFKFINSFNGFDVYPVDICQLVIEFLFATFRVCVIYGYAVVFVIFGLGFYPMAITNVLLYDVPMIWSPFIGWLVDGPSIHSSGYMSLFFFSTGILELFILIGFFLVPILLGINKFKRIEFNTKLCPGIEWDE